MFYKPEHDAKGGPNGTEQKGLEMQKWNIPMDRAQKLCVWETWGHLFSYRDYSQSYVHWNTNDSFFVFSADDSKKVVSLWAKYLNTSVRSFWTLSEYDVLNGLWIYCSWDVDSRKIRKTAQSAKNQG